MRLALTFIALLPLVAPAAAQTASPLSLQVETILAQAPKGARFGVLVVDDAGQEILAIDPDQRFIPASNTKLFTTAAALDAMSDDAAAVEARAATSLALVPAARGAPDVVLTGGGTALSTANECVKRCLGGLLSGIAMKARKVGNVIADDTAFADQRWSPGMSWNNIPTESGTAASAIVVDDNEVPLVVSPGTAGAPGVVAVTPYFTVRNEVQTIAEGQTRLAFDRAVGSRELRVYGMIPVNAAPWRERLGIDDPAEFAGWLVREGLLARGVKVGGKVIVRHRPLQGLGVVSAPAKAPEPRLALAVMPAPLAEEVAVINKPSQNLRAEVLLRRLGLVADAKDPLGPVTGEPGSLESGVAAINATLARAGIARTAYDFSDGSGMSTYNRISPRAAVGLLTWAKGQAWAPVWRASLPVGGIDGTLRRRFIGTPVAGKVWAKTGTLNATNALSGYLQAASGRELTFSILANDVPGDASAVPMIDALVVAIAAAN
ncbi:D-alanyl-D-alanine carboxypeptidase/D-alanyl-D-alanine-endopeptidase (penicillin-binding protein 4) [Novosphingobium kunmingense]|uniref:D-alanyl-D-alanine carboxypeptidase/D-alanyl-D-alanine-endopeptidase (Penicillin-binding protein 4) n=1 Tax=Novosphingobium kunmingense TaxID=1211806 RepID=A0A2N0I121_9SPHN|nr:D-alanyl-D-alanine carboxypeptidase/D-alanyl-D-alanine-endopeptidase [Novosphingobium kunmingense]PKB24889.1 D-alanyl-D-alanine carboxypeptidase/D-alanyl-D-alanine-endopeptidase (penicillin-binding protein 4) [Novosphingobium kunmingense]